MIMIEEHILEVHKIKKIYLSLEYILFYIECYIYNCV